MFNFKMNETDIYEGQEKLYTLHDQVLQAGFVDFKKEPSEYLEAPVKKPKKKQRSRAKGAPKGNFLFSKLTQIFYSFCHFS